MLNKSQLVIQAAELALGMATLVVVKDIIHPGLQILLHLHPRKPNLLLQRMILQQCALNPQVVVGTDPVVTAHLSKAQQLYL